ncbi:MAG: type II secretion system F family protein [Actinomycetota bacterium]
MSEAYLFVAVGATFVATALLGMRMLVTSRNRRGAAVLQGQLETAGIQVGMRGADASFNARIVSPATSRLSALISRYTPRGIRDSLAHRLALAGNPRGLTPELFLLCRLACGGGGAALGYYMGVTRGPLLLGIFWVPFMAYGGYLFAGNWLDKRVTKRQDSIRRDLADMIDLLTISVEAGLAFDGALLHARRAMAGPLSEEVGRLLHEMQLGAPRVEAMRRLSERTSVEELKSFVLAMVQADVFGVSISNVLRGQSQELRVKRRQRAEEKAMKTPVKLLFPMICCIMPSLLVVIVGPGVIRISHLFGPVGP